MPIKLKKINKKDIILWGLIFIPYLLLIPAAFWYFSKIDSIDNSSIVIINKEFLKFTEGCSLSYPEERHLGCNN